METYNTQIPAQKLKDSCDLCSASKLRCNKQKPTCTRCATLNRPCIYSPARRAGRPHHVRQEKSQSQSQSQSQGQSQSQSQRQTPQQGFGAPDANTSNRHLEEPTAIPGQTESEMSCDNGWFPSTHSIRHHQDNKAQSAGISSSPCNIMSTRLGSDTAETDCTKVALWIVEQLEMSKGRRSAAPTYGGSGLTATEACQRMLTILMCPCSERVDVALLVASGCISVMDMVHRSAGADFERGSMSLDVLSSEGTSITHGSCEQDILMWSRPQSSSRRSASDGQTQVGDLSKIAKVILQFTDRYCQHTKGGARWKHTTWVVAPVAALLRCRLHFVTHRVARRLVS
ncbi:hypothetical protein CNMCM5793_006446 [Aspergillus hiratsukae]|uniref:Zn(2)-C6 fungal-type domain-containing protein n=1 Tax=Aspergillus hiratsukae TaxID=1194566 RepID=A0A8H6QB94_9EURO|nr:hypothetical protein CNMCM5793_006446 [Aspergillus hiratsukae]KAF7169428.1 hypothetical protein CNMCM6106_004333 [Aspergillus hiratsukae]